MSSQGSEELIRIVRIFICGADGNVFLAWWACKAPAAHAIAGAEGVCGAGGVDDYEWLLQWGEREARRGDSDGGAVRGNCFELPL